MAGDGLVGGRQPSVRMAEAYPLESKIALGAKPGTSKKEPGVKWLPNTTLDPGRREPGVKARLQSRELTAYSGAARARLDLCLSSNAARIGPGDVGPHVKAIQDALKAIRLRMPGLELPEIEDPEGRFGPDTAAAIRRYNAINATTPPGQQSEALVGRDTLIRIDSELMNTAAPPPIAPIVIKAPVVISAIPDNPNKGDLNFKPVAPSDLSGAELKIIGEMLRQDGLSSKSTLELEEILTRELTKADPTLGPIIANDFFHNTSLPSADSSITHPVGSKFSDFIAQTKLFKAYSAYFCQQLDRAIKGLGKDGPFDPTLLKDRAVFEIPSWTPRTLLETVSAGASIANSFLPFTASDFQDEQAKMMSILGSLQGARVLVHDFSMNPFTREYSGTLYFELIDHIGVDNEDLIFDSKGHGTDGQRAFWILQHQRHESGSHMPYRLKVVISQKIEGSF